MEFTDNATTGDLLAEISRLEDQVAKLSSQLAADHQTISLLKQSLLERDSRIDELQSNLVIMPKFLLQNAQHQLEQCKIQTIKGIDEKIIAPAFALIRQQIQLIQHLTENAQAFIDRAKRVIQQHIETSVELASKSPEQARQYIETTVLEPLRVLVRQAIEATGKIINSAQSALLQNVISPSKAFYEHGRETVLALPSHSQIMIQVWFIEPALQTLHQLADSGRKWSDEAIAGITRMLAWLRSLLDRGLAFIAEQVRNSPFWDGKRNIEALS